MEFLSYFFMILIFAFTVINIKNAVRAFVTGKKAGILKVRIEPASAILFAVIGIAAIATSVNRFSAAREYRARATSYEKILSIGDSAGNSPDNYQQLSSSLDSRAKFEETIKKLRDSADTMSGYAWYMVLFGAVNLTWIFGAISYFTEEGIVSNQFKIPEPVTAVFRNGKIDVSIAADLKKNKMVWSFKDTPQNLAVFGRFIEWDEPETETEGQTVLPPDNSNMQT